MSTGKPKQTRETSDVTILGPGSSCTYVPVENLGRAIPGPFARHAAEKCFIPIPLQIPSLRAPAATGGLACMSSVSLFRRLATASGFP